MIVSELIEHLKTLNPDLEILYVMFDDGYSFYKLKKEDVREGTYEDYSDGEEHIACLIGEEFM